MLFNFSSAPEKTLVWPLPWAVSVSAPISLEHRYHLVRQVPLDHCWVIYCDETDGRDASA